LERHIFESVGGACAGIPTVTVCGNYNKKGASSQSGDGLATWVLKVPTPRATDGSKGGPNNCGSKGDLALPAFAARFPTPDVRGFTNDGALQKMADIPEREGMCFRAGRAKKDRIWFPTPCLPGNGGTHGKEKLKEALLATPTARDWKSGKASRETMEKNSRPPSEQIGGQLNPTWVEWLMGWPLGWTELSVLAMDKFRSARRLRSKSSGRK
jgi:hypothetical protein